MSSNDVPSVPSARPWRPRSAWARAAIGVGIALILLGLQSLILPGTPIHFAPALATVLVCSWWLGWGAGLAATITGAIAVNFLFLSPPQTWSLGMRDLLACSAFIGLGAIGAWVADALRRRLDRLQRRQDESRRALEQQSQRIAAIEREKAEREQRLEAALREARELDSSYRGAQRYVSAIERMLAELQASITDFPLPFALLTNEDGTPTLRAASAALSDLAGLQRGASPAFLAATGSLVSAQGAAFPADQHPFVRAFRGEPIQGQLAGWLTPSELHTVLLYLKPVGQTSLLALTMVPLARAPLQRVVH